MLLDHDPFSISFFKNSCPPGIFPVCRFSFPLVDIVKITEEPGYIFILREMNLQITQFVPDSFEIWTCPEAGIFQYISNPEFYLLIRSDADEFGVVSNCPEKQVKIFFNSPAENIVDLLFH